MPLHKQPCLQIALVFAPRVQAGARKISNEISTFLAALDTTQRQTYRANGKLIHLYLNGLYMLYSLRIFSRVGWCHRSPVSYIPFCVRFHEAQLRSDGSLPVVLSCFLSGPSSLDGSTTDFGPNVYFGLCENQIENPIDSHEPRDGFLRPRYASPGRYCKCVVEVLPPTSLNNSCSWLDKDSPWCLPHSALAVSDLWRHLREGKEPRVSSSLQMCSARVNALTPSFLQ